MERMADVGDILERVENAICKDEVWRAKEILRGNIGNRGFSPRLYERYGELLLKLGERYEAGKYLFLSGERNQEYEEAISLFLNRHSNVPSNDIVRQFPRGARLEDVSHYPEPLRSDLHTLGVRGRLPVSCAGPRKRGGKIPMLAKLGCFVALLALAVVVGLSLIGLGVVLTWIFGDPRSFG
jgi:hypothetical protein